MPNNRFPDFIVLVKDAVLSVKANFKFWVLMMQVSLFISVLGLFVQVLLTGFTGIFGILLSFALTAPLYAALFTSALRINNDNFQSRNLFDGYKNFFPVLAVASVESIFFFILIFPLNTYIGYLVADSGISLEQLRFSPSMDEQKMRDIIDIITALVQKNVLNIALLTIPVWPAFAWVRARLFSAYFFVIEKKQPMGIAIIQSFRISGPVQFKITAFVLLTDILFPVLLVLFFITYPLKYAIFGKILHLLVNEKIEYTKSQQNFSSEFKNPYL